MEDKNKLENGAALGESELDEVSGGVQVPYDRFAEIEKVVAGLTTYYHCEKCQKTYTLKFTEYNKFIEDHIAGHNAEAAGGK